MIGFWQIARLRTIQSNKGIYFVLVSIEVELGSRRLHCTKRETSTTPTPALTRTQWNSLRPLIGTERQVEKPILEDNGQYNSWEDWWEVYVGFQPTAFSFPESMRFYIWKTLESSLPIQNSTLFLSFSYVHLCTVSFWDELCEKYILICHT